MRNKHRKQRRSIKRMERMRFEALPFWEQIHILVGRFGQRVIEQQNRLVSTLCLDHLDEMLTPPASTERARKPIAVVRT